MRLLWIVIGVLVLMWLGFLTISRNSIELRLDGHDEQINGLDDRYELRQDIAEDEQTQNKGIIDKVEDRIDKKEDKLDKKTKMPYETNEPTMKHIRDLDEKEQKKVKLKSNGEANAKQSVVAFDYIVDPISDTLYNQPTVEAFELKANDSVVAFKLK